MANVLYKRVDYKLENLLLDIETGKLGLPDLQRHFVWQNSKVRDLFDSMMKGYPVGYLMLWDAPADSEESGRQIGLVPHTHETPKQLIIDGQQRLTSLYAVMYGKPILDSKFKERPISIAFNPVQRKFEVTSAAHRRSAEWIAEISEVYKNANSSFSFISSFISDLDAVRQRDGNPLTGEEQQLIAQNIQDLLNLKDYMIPTLCITDDADEEAVADVFVRVNSGGKNLNEKVLFSTTPIRNLFSPGASGTRSAIEKHHLFPKEYLPLIGIVDDKQRNQIANFTYIEWPENCAASDSAPEVYWSALTSGMTAESIGQMCMENALPDNWTTLPYLDFLEKRRMLMAEIIRKGYDCLCGQG